MRFNIRMLLALFLIFNQCVAMPHWDPAQLPKDSDYSHSTLALPNIEKLKTVYNNSAVDVLRIRVDWQEHGEVYTLANAVIEASGTQALLARSVNKPNLGSYLGVLVDKQTGLPMYYDSIGTGSEYRKLARAITMRFPVPENDMIFELYAENPQNGVMEKVLSQNIFVNELENSKKTISDVEVKELSISRKQSPLRVNIYSEGYLQNEKDLFWTDALKMVRVMQEQKFPGVENMNFYAVFHASNQKLGAAQKLGVPIPEYNSFLGLYYPYWDASSTFERWYNVVYPTREEKLRESFAVAAYDYPFVLVNNSEYFGVGNYMTFVAIPARTPSYFTMLVMHEAGHFFGLNEEYDGGGGTELAFSPNIREPWSQNMTFSLNETFSNTKVKWQSFVNENTPIPTPSRFWQSSSFIYGAYTGGYGGTAELHGRVNYKPGLACMMDRAQNFCNVCKHAINEIVNYSRGVNYFSY